MKVQFLPVGRSRREWTWAARDGEGRKVVAISGQRFDSLNDAVRDARTHIDSLRNDDGADDGPFVA